MSSIEEKYMSLIKLEKQRSSLSERILKAHKELEALRKDQEIKCSCCGNVIRVGSIELIREESDHWTDSNDDVRCRTEEYWVCPACTNVFSAALPKDDIKFPSGFHSYVKVVHVWDSSRERCHGRVLELLKPHFERQESKRRELEMNRRLNEARELLKNAGEL